MRFCASLTGIAEVPAALGFLRCVRIRFTLLFREAITIGGIASRNGLARALGTPPSGVSSRRGVSINPCRTGVPGYHRKAIPWPRWVWPVTTAGRCGDGRLPPMRTPPPACGPRTIRSFQGWREVKMPGTVGSGRERSVVPGAKCRSVNEGVGEHVRTRSHLRALGPGEIADPKIRTERRKLVSSAGPVFERASSFEKCDPAV